MTNVDEKLFLSATNKVLSAETLIYECINLIDNYEVIESSDYVSAKNNIKNCGIDILINKINEERNWLINYDQDFARNYFSLLNETLQTGNENLQNMTSEEQAEYIINYNAYQKEFNDVCIAILEKNDKNGMLTKEMQDELKMRKKMSEQYKLKDEMLKVDIDSDKYVELYEKYANYDREVISLNPSLTEEQKIEILKQYDINYEKTISELDYRRDIANLINDLKKLELDTDEYYKKSAEINQRNIDYYNYIGVDNLTDVQLEILKEQEDYRELNILFMLGDEALIRQKKVEMGIASDAEIEYENASWFGRALINTKTVTATFVTSLGGIGEAMVDGGIMLTAGCVGLFNEDVAKWTEDAVGVNWSDDAYDGMVMTGVLNSYSAYSAYHTVTDVITTTGGYIALSLIPGLGGSAVMALAAGGNSAQTAFDNGANFREAWGSTVVSAGLAFFSDVGMDKLNASSVSTLLKTTGRTAIGVGEPLINAGVEYVTYGNDGSLSLKGFHEYAKESGTYTNMAIGGTVANVAGAISDYSKARNAAKTAEYKTDFNTNMDDMTDAQRAQVWSDYYSQQYGEAFEGRFSGHGDSANPMSFIDPKSGKINANIELNSRNFDEVMDLWALRVADDNYSNALWDGSKKSVKDILELNGIKMDEKSFGKYYLGEGKVNVTQLLFDSGIMPDKMQDLLVDIQDGLDRNIRRVNADASNILQRALNDSDRIRDDVLNEIIKGDIKDVDGFIQKFGENAEKWELRKKHGIYWYSTLDDIKKTDYYQDYVNNVISKERYDEVIEDFFEGNTSTKVYNVQKTADFDTYVIENKTLGRNEGNYIISQKTMKKALIAANKNGLTDISYQQIDDFLAGKLHLDLDMEVFEDSLGFSKGYFKNGATIVQAPANVDTVRVSTPLDEGANVYYRPNYKISSGANELLNAQINNLKFDINNNVYTDLINDVYAIKI